MAGGKETPRQKMIGMMYLVLTALLALQVSNAVLEKFIFINGTLEELVKENVSKNQKALSGIQATVQDKGNRPADVKALDKAKQVRDLTSSLMVKMADLKKEMIDITGGIDEKTGELIGAKDYDKVGNMMLESNVGKEFEKELDEYVNQLNTIAGTNFSQLTKGASEIEVFKNDPNQKGKDFLTLTFQNTPTAAGLASVSQLQAEALEYENVALQAIAEQVGAKDIDFDKIVPMVRPASRAVAAGGTYEADMFITASATGITPEFALNGDAIESIEDPQTGIKMGKVKFRATPGNYDPKTNMAKKTFTASITLNDSVYSEEIEYFVIKPTIQVRSAALSALYQNCCNPLDVQVPALGADYNPSFSSSEAKIVKGNRPGLVTVIPQGRSKVKLTVSNAGNVLGTETFDVKKIPPPSIQLKSRGRGIDLENGVSGSALTNLNVDAEPDENFAREVPDDARYRVTRVLVKHARGGRPINTQTFTSQNVDLRAWRSNFRPGDILSVKVEQVVRRTCGGDNERVRPLQDIFTIPIK